MPNGRTNTGLSISNYDELGQPLAHVYMLQYFEVTQQGVLE